MKNGRLIALAALSLMLASCVSLEMKEDTPSLNGEQCELPADVEVGSVTAEIPISSNQSWTARTLGVCRWARLSNTEHINPSGVTDSGSFTVELEDNDAYEPRSFDVVITGKDLTKTITVTQLAKKNRIRVVEALSQSLPPEPEPRKITVLSNTAWSVDADSAKCILSDRSGYGDREIEVKFTPNYSKDTASVVAVTLFCEDADTIRMNYVLERNAPFVRVGKNYETISLLPTDTTAVISFHVNDKWKAEILNSDMEDLKADAVTGDAGLVDLGFSFRRNKSESIREATVRISLEQYPDVYKDVRLVHRKGIALSLNFTNGVANLPLKPATPSDPPLTEHVKDGLAHNYIFTFDGEDYYFTIQSPGEYYYYYSGKNFYCSKGYLMLPSIDGRRLVEVQVVSANGKRYSVCEDSAGKIYLDGGIIYTTTSGVPAKWVLTNTSVSASYFLYLYDNGTQTRKFTLIYE